MSYSFADYSTAGANPLEFTRYYNSRDGFSAFLGVNWHSTFDRFIWLYSSSQVAVQRQDGQMFVFNLIGNVWTPDGDVDYKLMNSGTQWTLTAPDDSVEVYTSVTTGYAANYQALLQTIQQRNGYIQRLTYDANNLLQSATDSYDRKISMAYNADGTLASITTPDNTTIVYGYTTETGTQNLTSVTYPTSSPTSLTYVYGNAALPNLLTSVLDENNNSEFSWTYDSYGRALTSQIGNGANASITSLAYNDTTGGRTVTNPLGVTETYGFSALQNTTKVTSISRAATSTTAAATRSFAYDSNGYLARATDWNGNITTYVNNSHGNPTTINEAVASTVARTATIAYDPTWIHLPHSIATPGLTTSYSYDASGELLSETLTDTTTTTAPYSTNGQTRITTNTWSNSLLTSVKTPRGHTTTFDYDSTGALTSVTDALSHETSVTAHTGGGLPETIVDPNGVTTIKTYDPRQRILTSTVSTSAGALETEWVYQNNGQISYVLPDGSAINTLLDSAHRLYGLTDNLPDVLAWGLDNNGDAINTQIADPTDKLVFSRTAAFDSLGRKLQDASTVTGASTVWTYDNNGDALTSTDPLGHKTTNVFDSLNRLTTSTDANSGAATVTYDAHDRPLTVKDKSGNTTTYIYDGFGDLIEQVSPDSGTTVFHYDSDGNLTSRTDAAGVVTNWTYDALDRPLTKSFPADPNENVAFTYDQAGHGFGIGRLTSVSDAAGTVSPTRTPGLLSRSYDERGNVLKEQRTVGTTVLTTAYTYDKASRVASITYPSGAVSTYTRDAIGRVISMPFSATNSDETKSVYSAAYLPFASGPLTTLYYNNGDNSSHTYDEDYRLAGLTYQSQKNVPYFKWIYGYDNANDVTSITDGITSVNSQAMQYDVLNRLTGASSSGTYGTLSYKYDKNGNLTSSVLAGTTYTDSYTSGTNRLSSITWPGNNTQTFAYTPDGSISTINVNGKNSFTLTYNNDNRLSTAIGGNVPLAISPMLYDYAGKRVVKDNPGDQILYSYDLDGDLVEESDNGIVTDYIYLNGINVANWEPSEKHLYFVNVDARGVPQVTRDSHGLTNWAGYTAPYGQTTQTVVTDQYTGPVTQNLRLPGQYLDHETGFHQNGFRDFMPAFGRYLETDPIGLGGGLNTYAYVGGNPLTFVDPTGLCQSWDTTCNNAMRAAGLPQWENHSPPVSPTQQHIGACSMECDIVTIPACVGVSLYTTPLGGGLCTVAKMCICHELCKSKYDHRGNPYNH